MRVHIAADHAGYELKEHLVAFLSRAGHDVTDHGAHGYDAEDDFGKKVKSWRDFLVVGGAVTWAVLGRRVNK